MKRINSRPSVSRLDVDDTSTSERLTVLFLSLETDGVLLTEKKSHNLLFLLLVISSATGDLFLSDLRDRAPSGWTGVYPWDPGGNSSQVINQQHSLIQFSDHIYCDFILYKS